MAFNRDKLTDINARVKADLDAGTGTDPRLQRTNTAALAHALAGESHELHGHIDHEARQLFTWSADEEELGLKAAFWGVDRKQPAPAVGQASGTGQNGAVIPAGHLLQRSDGREYQTTAEVTVATGAFDLDLEAVEPGLDSDCPAATGLTMITPIVGVDTAVTVDSDGLTGGADLETLDRWRARISTKARRDVDAGHQSRYVKWALEVPGVTRAWAFPQRTGLGTVGVSFVMDGRSDIIPVQADLDAVSDYIEGHTDPETGQEVGRPVTAVVQIFAFTAEEIDFTIQLKSAVTQAVKDAVEAELADLIFREGEPEGTLLISHIREAISIAAGEVDHDLQSPIADVVLTAGQMPVMGSITWVV